MIEPQLKSQFALHCARHGAQLREMVDRRIPAKLRSYIQAEDVLHDAFCAALPRFDTFEERGDGSFVRWMTVIIKRRLANCIRAHLAIRRRGTLMHDSSSDSPNFFESIGGAGRSPSRAAMARDNAAVVSAALGVLDPARREAIEAHFLRARPLEEIARELGTTAAGVRSLVYRGLADLRERLGRESRFFSGEGRRAGGDPDTRA